MVVQSVLEYVSKNCSIGTHVYKQNRPQKCLIFHKGIHKNKQNSCNAVIAELRLEVQLGPFAELRLGSRYLGVRKPKAHANQRDPQYYFFSYAISLYEYI